MQNKPYLFFWKHGFPKGGDWGRSDIWEKIPQKSRFFFWVLALSLYIPFYLGPPTCRDDLSVQIGTIPTYDILGLTCQIYSIWYIFLNRSFAHMYTVLLKQNLVCAKKGGRFQNNHLLLQAKWSLRMVRMIEMKLLSVLATVIKTVWTLTASPLHSI